MADIAYSQRYCAYVDIIGFRELVHSIGADQSKFEAMKGVLDRVHTHRQLRDMLGEIRTQSISDAIALSSEVTGAGLNEIFDTLETLSIDLLCEGYFLRGAVVRGLLYHDDHMVFGEALVRAYEIESKQARYPRIVVLREVREDMIKYGVDGKGPRITRLRQSEDGPMYLDVLQRVVGLGRKERNPYGKLDGKETLDVTRYSKIRDKIQNRFEEAMDVPRHFEKVQWFAKYWNEAISGRTEFGRVLGRGIDKAFQ